MIEAVGFHALPSDVAIESAAALVVRRFPTQTNASLLEYARSLGPLSLDGITSSTNQIEDHAVHLVRECAVPARDPFNNVMISTTSDPFPLHTDEYFSLHPARFILLLCISPAKSGGTSRISRVSSVVRGLGSRALDLLRRPVFPSQVGKKAVLAEDDWGWRVQFNEVEMQRAAALLQADWPTSRAIEGAIREFRECAAACCSQLELQEGDCLAISNWRALHGRTGFATGEHRLLKRVRIK